jgi:serine/threonine-protein kinase
VENLGNKAEHLGFSGAEPGKRLRFTFRPSELEVRPGQRASVGVDVRARRRVWGGVEKSRQFSVSVARPEGPPVPPMPGRFTQFASWPKWVLPVVFAALAVVIPTALVFGVRALNEKAANAPVEVPSLIGITADAAQKSLEERGLTANVENKFHEGTPAGQVFEQTPPAGEKVAPKGIVNVSVAADLKVPNVKEKTVEVAQQVLANVGLTLVLGGDVPGTPDKENTIAEQLPDADQPATGKEVKVFVRRANLFKLPNYEGSDELSATVDLKNNGYQVEPSKVEDSDLPRGIIISQYPPAGTIIEVGKTVAFIVSSGNRPAPTTTAFATGPTTT